MKKKLDTRFPAARIKKIMQADEEVGKIASATPVLISKALELFLQDLCDRTYDITLKKGAKTMNSQHLKECVRRHSVFDFLEGTVSHVPDLDVENAGGSDTGRRRKAVEKDNDDSCEDDSNKRSRSDPSSSRGRGRGRGRGRKSNGEKSKNDEHVEDGSPKLRGNGSNFEEGETSGVDKEPVAGLRLPKDFDLNMELDENGEVAIIDNEAVENIQQMGLGFTNYAPEEDYDCEE